MLTREEKMLIAETLNGTFIPEGDDPRSQQEAAEYLRMMCGDSAAIDPAAPHQNAFDRIRLTGVVLSGLEHEIFDAITMDELDSKWGVDGPALLNKIADMTPAQREQLIRDVHAAWKANAEQFTTALEAIAL